MPFTALVKGYTILRAHVKSNSPIHIPNHPDDY